MFSLKTIVSTIFYLIIAGLIFAVLWWLIHVLALPAPFGWLAEVVLYIAGALVIIGVLLGLAGYPIIKGPGGPPQA